MHVISKTESTQVRVGISDYSGTDKIDIRTYVKTKNHTDFIATSKGVSLDIEQLDDLLMALTALKAEYKAPKMKVRFAIADNPADIVGKPPYKDLSSALVATGEAGDFIWEVQNIDKRVVKVAVYTWSSKKDTWVKV